MPHTKPPADAGRPGTAPAGAGPQARPTYRRVLLKLSGESFAKPGQMGIDPEELGVIAGEVRDAARAGASLAVVVGGGNFIRGAALSAGGKFPRATADYMGMLGTVMNALALKEQLLALGVDCRVLSALEIRSVAEPFIRGRAIRHLEKGRVVILAAGTGNPFFSTDTCAALRASELDCDLVAKATKVDGVYDSDPMRNPAAKRFDTLTMAEALNRRLAVMDLTAIAMCQDNRLPVLVFEFKRPGNIRRVVIGEAVGTLVTVA